LGFFSAIHICLKVKPLFKDCMRPGWWWISIGMVLIQVILLGVDNLFGNPGHEVITRLTGIILKDDRD